MDGLDDKPPRRAGRRMVSFWPGGAISALALVGVAVHLIFPRLKIDAVSLALIGLAVVPWLGPILESIELPGGWRFEFRRVEHAVETLQRKVDAKSADIETLVERVQEVERLVILGTTSPVLERELNADVRAFGTRLRSLHPSLTAPLPVVRIVPEFGAASYDVDAQEITLDPALAESPYFVLRALAHHLLLKPGRLSEPNPGVDPEPAAFDVESGLADYLVASHLQCERLGRIGLNEKVRVLYCASPEASHVRDLTNGRRFDEIAEDEPYQSGGEVWAATFWELRQLYGPELVDRQLVAAWAERPELGPLRDSPAFAEHLVVRLDPSHRSAARRLFERRGLRAGALPGSAPA